MKLEVREYNNRQMGDAELANVFKTLGYEPHYAWDMYVKYTNQKPRVDAKEFYKLFDDAPGDWKHMKKYIEFTPTHYDSLCKQTVQITKGAGGVYDMVWQDGTIGTNPPMYPPEPERYWALKQ